MTGHLLRALIVMAVLGVTASSAPEDIRMIEVEGDGARYWPRWRGPSGQGLVPDGAYTDAWSPTSRVQWKAALPGTGNSSPVVWGEQIFLTTAVPFGEPLKPRFVRPGAHDNSEMTRNHEFVVVERAGVGSAR